jgi:hypothetical protein
MSRRPDDSPARQTPRQARRPSASEPPRERRAAPRVTAEQLPTFSAHIVDGPVIEVVNVSRNGILTRSAARLMPGAMIGLRILTADDSFLLFGRVVRSRLLSIDGGAPLYESALALSHEFPLLVASTNRPFVESGVPSERPDGEYPVEIGRLHGAPTVLTITAFANDTREQVMRALELDE